MDAPAFGVKNCEITPSDKRRCAAAQSKHTGSKEENEIRVLSLFYMMNQMNFQLIIMRNRQSQFIWYSQNAYRVIDTLV